MTDYVFCYTGPQDIQLDTGKGHLAGVMMSTTEAISGAITLYDYAGAAPPTGPRIFEIVINAYNSPAVILFNDRYAPRFKDGIWLHLSDHCYAQLWFHIPKI